MSRQNRKDKKELKGLAENLLVDYELRNQSNNQLDKSMYNMEIMEQNVDNQINMKKDLLKELRARRVNNSENVRVNHHRDQILKSKLNDARAYSSKKLEIIETKEVTTIDIDRKDFNSYEYNRAFALENNIDLRNPFLNLYSKNEQVRISKEMIQKFEVLELDKSDYAFASAAGIIAGFIDTIFVGTIAKGKEAKGLQKYIDIKVEELVKSYGLKQKIASLEEKKKYARSEKSIKQLNGTIKEYKDGTRKFDVKSAIRFLEKNNNVGYDAATSENIKGMSPDNHHLLSIAHEPSLLGLIVGIYNQLTGTATYMTKEGFIKTVAAENKNKELSGNIANQIIQATNNWFGHIMSDISGSSTSKGRGSGLPVPGWSSLQTLQFGKIPLKQGKKDTSTIAEVSEWMFKNGYDLRSFTAELIPVVIYETLIRVYWFYKQKFYYGNSFKESLPVANNRELSRLLLVGASTFSAIDVTHGVIRAGMSGGPQPQGVATFIMTVNKPGLVDLGFRSYQNIRLELQHKKHVNKVMEEDILVEYKRVISSRDVF